MATVKKKVTAKKPMVKKAATKKPAVKKFQNGGVKDKWGRSANSKWYGYNPETKKYEAVGAEEAMRKRIQKADEDYLNNKPVKGANSYTNARARKVIGK